MAGQTAPLVGGLVRTFTASEAMATANVAVKLATNEGEIALAGDGEQAIGVLLAAVASGDLAQVQMTGECYVCANTTITKGVMVNSAASTGKVAVVGSTEYALGMALTAATAQNDLIVILLTPGSYK